MKKAAAIFGAAMILSTAVGATFAQTATRTPTPTITQTTPQGAPNTGFGGVAK